MMVGNCETTNSVLKRSSTELRTAVELLQSVQSTVLDMMETAQNLDSQSITHLQSIDLATQIVECTADFIDCLEDSDLKVDQSAMSLRPADVAARLRRDSYVADDTSDILF